MIRITLVIGALLLSGCASLMDARDYTLGKPFDQNLSAPPPEKAQAVFYFPEPLTTDLAVPVHEDDKIIGALKGGSYFIYAIEPGKRHFDMQQFSLTRLELDVWLTALPGKTYFFKYTRLKQFEYPVLKLMPEDVALAELQGLEELIMHERAKHPETKVVYRDARY